MSKKPVCINLTIKPSARDRDILPDFPSRKLQCLDIMFCNAGGGTFVHAEDVESIEFLSDLESMEEK